MNFLDRREGGSNTRTFLAVVITLGFFTTLLALFLIKDDQLRDARLIVLGSLTGSFGLVVGFYFGSTSSSEQKNKLLANSPPGILNPASITTTTATAGTTVTVETEEERLAREERERMEPRI